MEGYLNRGIIISIVFVSRIYLLFPVGLYGTLGMKYIQMWASLKSPCLYFWQSYSVLRAHLALSLALTLIIFKETAELKSAVVLRWLTVDIADEVTFTIELRPWQHLLFPSDHQV
jgi:hypothetical protein